MTKKEEAKIDLYVDRIASWVAEGGWLTTSWASEPYLGLDEEDYYLVPSIRAALPEWVLRDSDVNYAKAVNDL